jgi:rootletin
VLQIKLQSNKEQLTAIRKQCDTAEANTQTLTAKVTDLISQLDTCRSECTQMNQEKDMLQQAHDVVKLEKNALDKAKMELNNAVRCKINLRLSKICFIYNY